MLLPVVPFPPSGVPPGKVVSTLGSGILVSGTGMVMVSVGIALLVPVELVELGVVAGALLVQAQAHKEMESTSPMTQMAIFFIRILLEQ